MKTSFQFNQVDDDDQLKFAEKVFNNHQISRNDTRESIPTRKNRFLGIFMWTNSTLGITIKKLTN